VRAVGLGWAALLSWTLYTGCAGLGLGRLPALLAALFAAFSPELIGTFGLLTPHGAYTVVSTATLFLAAHALRAGSGRAWAGAALGAGLAFATLAFSLLLALAILLAAAIAQAALGRGEWRAASRACLRRSLPGAALFALLWPGGILELTLLRGYAFYGYLALARPVTYGRAGPLEAWRSRLAHSPLEWGILLALLLAGCVLVWQRRRKFGDRTSLLDHRAWVLPFLVYGTLIAATTLFITTPRARYIASLMPVLFVLAAAALALLFEILKPGLRLVLGTAISCALAANLSLADREAPLAPEPGTRLDDRVVENLRAGSARDRWILSGYYVPLARWYMPQAALLGRDRPDDLVLAASHWKPDAVLYQGPRDPELEAELSLARGTKIDESITLSGESVQITILRFARGSP
jgi:hypothetical protein